MTSTDNLQQQTIDRSDKLIIKEPNYNEEMVNAANRGHIDNVKLMLEKGANNYNDAMVNAANGGHIDIVKLMLEKGANYYNWTMAKAANGGHIDIVKLMLEKGANNYNWAMSRAAKGGHIDIVKLMLEKGADNYNYAINAAKRGCMRLKTRRTECRATYFGRCGCYTDIINLLRKYDQQAEKLSLRRITSVMGILLLVVLLIPITIIGYEHSNKERKEDNLAMSNAAKGGHIDIVKLMLEKGANDYNSAMSSAAQGGHIDIIKLMLEKRANNYNSAVPNAA